MQSVDSHAFTVDNACTSTDNKTMHVNLQIARLSVSGSKHDHSATLLFDSGSDTTYVSAAFAKRVGLTVVGQRYSGFTAFGGKSSPSVLRDVYSVPCRSLANSSMQAACIRAVEVPVICAPLRRPRVPSNVLDNLQGYQLSYDHHRPGSVKIDMLTGMDNYWNLMKESAIRLSQGLVMQESVFGWAVSGYSHVQPIASEATALFSSDW
jgi:hypothetical protein